MTRPLTGGDGPDQPRPRLVPDDPIGVLRRDGFTLGEWRVEPRRNRIVSDQQERGLDPRLIDVLIQLAARPGDVITREELLETVWEGVFVSENTLSQVISRLRRALGDDPRKPRFIETIAKSGYRLVAPVRWNGGTELRAVEPTANGAPIPDGPVVQPTAAASTSAARPDPSPVDRSSPTPDRAPAIPPTEIPPETPPAPDTRARQRSPMRLWVVAAMVLAAALGWLFRDALAPATIGPPVIAPESTLIGRQFEPVLSPTGDRLIFAWRGPDEDAPFDLWIQSIGGDAPTRLTDTPADFERLPTWSRDGQSVLYLRANREEQVCGIYRSAIVGGPPERLADCPATIRGLSESPNGEVLALSAASAADQTVAIQLLTPATGEIRPLTAPPDGSRGDQSPIFSPDGNWIAFSRRVGSARHDVMIVSADGAETRTLTDDRWGQQRGVEWSPDGRHVLFSSNRSGSYAVWSVPVEGGAPQRLPIDDTWVTQPSVARDGGRMIYRTFRDVVDIWSLTIDDDGAVAGPPERRVASTRSERQPAPSPDGTAIAFVSDRSGTTEVWSADIDGTNARRHTSLSGPLPAFPRWSPDGGALLYDAAVDGHSDLWLVDREGKHPRRLTDRPSEERNGTFSRDGRSIYFASDRSGRWEIWRRSIDGGDVRQVTTEGGFLAHESPDGETLYFARLDRPGIWRMPRDGGAAHAVIDDLDLADWASWAITGEGLYLVRRQPTSIVLVDPAGGDPREVFRPEKQMPYLEPTLSVAADGRSLLFSMIDRSDDEIMRVDWAGF